MGRELPIEIGVSIMILFKKIYYLIKESLLYPTFTSVITINADSSVSIKRFKEDINA